MTTNLIIQFTVSILLGTLIGIEREKQKQKTKNKSPLGIRTSILISLFGTLSTYLGIIYNPAIFYISIITIILLVLSSHINLILKYNRIGITTEISAILLFIYGSMCAIDQIQLAVILTIITTLILSAKTYMHNMSEAISKQELFDTIKFAIIAFIILPILPNQNYDQQIFGTFFPQMATTQNSIDILNPYKIWLLIVFISGISFLGYILIKLLNKKLGISLTGLIGGLYSSTATSLTLANKSKKFPKTINPFLAGIVLACAISFIKSFIFIKALNETLFQKTLFPLSIMFLYMLITGLYLMFTSKKEPKHQKEEKNFDTPFSIKNALKLGLLIIIALIVAKISLTYADISLYYVVAILSAFFAIDDPIVVSTASTAGHLINYTDAKNIILLVTYLNMSQKVLIVYLFGNKKLTKPLFLVFFGLFLVTLIGFLYL